ncbi:MAG: hypothetical protein AAFQ23_13380, partial [Cyanobacteria bacterium J06623_1]
MVREIGAPPPLAPVSTSNAAYSAYTSKIYFFFGAPFYFYLPRSPTSLPSSLQRRTPPSRFIDLTMLNSNNFSDNNNQSKRESNQSDPQSKTDNKAISTERIEFYELEKQFRQLKNGFPATELLEAGGVAEWLQLRAEFLLSESNNNRMHGGLSQLLGLSVGVAAFALT